MGSSIQLAMQLHDCSGQSQMEERRTHYCEGNWGWVYMVL